MDRIHINYQTVGEWFSLIALSIEIGYSAYNRLIFVRNRYFAVI